ncbi:hypothetical protein [Actinomadura formosensis]|uniref:hypothetical protein n=1 Tax=Actinomadura formosensis TaxID=60706 RepID=UPI001041BC10|nr:hypothetical protein [Actinomadura formosensis]
MGISGRRTPYPAGAVTAVVLAVICAIIGGVGPGTADRGVERRSAVVAGVPMETVRPLSG